MPHPPIAVDVDALADRAAGLAARTAGPGRRCLIGIAGAPGAGKSTTAEAVVRELRRRGVAVALVPMDGFHLAHRLLERLGRAERKGAPDTFDAAGFAALLSRLRGRGETVFAPEFRREIEEPVAGAIEVSPDVDLVVTEGNYLLLEQGPWTAVRPLLDEVWFLDADPTVRRERLAARHHRYGRSQAEALDRTYGSDERNAALVSAGRERADLVLDASELPAGDRAVRRP